MYAKEISNFLPFGALIPYTYYYAAIYAVQDAGTHYIWSDVHTTYFDASFVLNFNHFSMKITDISTLEFEDSIFCCLALKWWLIMRKICVYVCFGWLEPDSNTFCCFFNFGFWYKFQILHPKTEKWR